MRRKLLTIVVIVFLFMNISGLTSRIHRAGANQTISADDTSPWGDWTHYHNYTEIVNTLLYLNNTFQDIVDLFPIGKSWQNKTIYCIRLTNESNTHPKPKLLFIGYHHAREPISLELPLYFAVKTATDYGLNDTVTRMLNYAEIYIVPALNVDGIEIRKQNEWQRKNAHPFDEDGDGLLDEDPPYDQDGDGYLGDLIFTNGTFIRWEGIDSDFDGNLDWVGGVDLNRNYGFQWNATCDSGSDNPSAEDFRGLAPFSEPETQAVRDLALQNSFKYAVSFHSGAEVILYPWGYADIQTPDDSVFQEIASNLSALTDASYERSAQMYSTSGVWDDWMYANRSTLAFTCEIYANGSAWQYAPGPQPDTWWERGITQTFNPDPINIEPTIQRWLPVFTYMIGRAITEAYDVTATDITLEKTKVASGSSIQVNATVENQGCFNEVFNVALKANTTSIQTLATTLANGSTTTLVFNWNTTGYALGNYTVSTYAEPLPGETDTTDNTFADGTVQIGQAPAITLLSPENQTYTTTSIPLNFTLDKPSSWIGYSVDGATNVTVTENTTLAGVLNGFHHVVLYANDTLGFMGTSNTLHFAVDTIFPNITEVTQIPLKNNVHPEDEVKVNITVTDDVSGVKRTTLLYTYANSSGIWTGVANMANLEGKIWNATIPAFPYGTNVTYTIIAEDNVGNVITTAEIGYDIQYQVVAEFPSLNILSLFAITTLLAIIARKRKPQG